MNKQGYIEERVLRKIDFVNKCVSPNWGYIEEGIVRKIDYVNKSKAKVDCETRRVISQRNIAHPTDLVIRYWLCLLNSENSWLCNICLYSLIQDICDHK